MIGIKKILPIVIILVLSYLIIRPLFIAGFFPFHDDTQIQRVFEMQKSLSDGMFPVRWVSDLGYGFGYPIFNFYAPLSYYIGGFFSLLGYNALASAKIMLGLGVILSGIAMYLFAKEIWGKSGGLISGILYLYAPYHAVDIFIRGDFAEIYAYAFIPLVFLAIYKLYNYQKIKLNLKNKNILWGWITVGSLSYAGLILSHNLTAMMITPFIIFYMFILFIKKPKSLTLPSCYFLLLTIGLLLSAFYWLPALTEMKYTNILSQIGGGADFRDHFVCLTQLWDSPWGYGGSTPDCFDGLSLKIGKLHLILALFSILSLFISWRKQKIIKTQIIFFIITFFISVLLMLEISKPLWEAVPQMAFFQYPWRFLIYASFAVSFLGGAIVSELELNIDKSKFKKIFLLFFTTLLILVIIFINKKLFTPQTIYYVQSSDFTNESNLKWKTSKTSDEYMPKNFLKPQTPDQIPHDKLTSSDNKTKIKIINNKTNYLSAQIFAEQNTNLHINLAYFPAWHVFIDNSEKDYDIVSNGLSINLPKGQHLLELKFIETPVEKLADLLSVAGVLALFAGIIIIAKENLNGKKAS